MKRSCTPFFLNFGYFARPAKKFWNATPNCMMAICGAFFVTSSIQGNCSRFSAFSCLRSAACDGLGSSASSLLASYWRCHSASAQL